MQQETGDVLHYIDFHQLQIENKQVVYADCISPCTVYVQDLAHATDWVLGEPQFAAKIEEKNGELLALKSTTANTVLMLTNLKVPTWHFLLIFICSPRNVSSNLHSLYVCSLLLLTCLLECLLA